MQSPEAIVILENIRSAHNVGAIFRTAEAVGVSKIYLVGYTPAPIDRFGRPQKDIEKTALGAQNVVPWEHVEKSDSLIERLKNEGVTIYAVERAQGAVDYKSVSVEGRVAVVLGNEVDGVEPTSCALADAVIEIPMRGMKESLNVSVAAGIIFYRLFDT